MAHVTGHHKPVDKPGISHHCFTNNYIHRGHIHNREIFLSLQDPNYYLDNDNLIQKN